MSQQTSNSLVNLGDLGKPIDTLINKISDATGVLYEPRRIRRKAEAESDAAITSAKAEAAVDIINAESEIEIADLHQRTVQRRVKEDMRDQKNMENIIAQIEPHLNEEPKPDDMEDDWIANFFDKCRIVSDSEMQNLWSRVLAGEANTPGTYSKRTVNLLSDFDKRDAELFTKFCGFGWMIRNSFVPLVFNSEAEIYNRRGIDFDSLSTLEDIGLIKLDFGIWSGFAELVGAEDIRLVVHYYDKSLILEMPGDPDNPDNMLSIGQTRLTKIGQELAPISGSKPVDGFYEYVKDRWKRYLPKVENTGQKE